MIVAMMHTNKAGKSKLLKKCSLPPTGVGCVKKIVTNLAVLEMTIEGFKLLEPAPNVSVADIKNATEGVLIFESDVPEMQFKTKKAGSSSMKFYLSLFSQHFKYSSQQ